MDDGIHPVPQPVDDSELFPLVLPEDKELISDYLYLALDQMQPAKLMDADRVGCYKSRRTGKKAWKSFSLHAGRWQVSQPLPHYNKTDHHINQIRLPGTCM